MQDWVFHQDIDPKQSNKRALRQQNIGVAITKAPTEDLWIELKSRTEQAGHQIFIRILDIRSKLMDLL